MLSLIWRLGVGVAISSWRVETLINMSHCLGGKISNYAIISEQSVFSLDFKVSLVIWWTLGLGHTLLLYQPAEPHLIS